MPIKNSEKIIEDLSAFFDKNETYTRKEFLEYAKEVYDNNFKKTKKVVDENAEKKPLNAYQQFMKEQRIIISKRENEKSDGSDKKKPTEIFKEIAELWKLQKSRVELKVEDKKLDKVDEEPKEENKLMISNDEEHNEAKVVKKKSNRVSTEVNEDKPKKKNGKWTNV